jgi:hypothetical protein
LFVYTKFVVLQNPAQGATPVLYAALAEEIEGKGVSYLSNCAEESCSAEAKNVEKQNKLFEVTCQDLGLEIFTP